MFCRVIGGVIGDQDYEESQLFRVNLEFLQGLALFIWGLTFKSWIGRLVCYLFLHPSLSSVFGNI